MAGALAGGLSSTPRVYAESADRADQQSSSQTRSRRRRGPYPAGKGDHRAGRSERGRRGRQRGRAVERSGARGRLGGRAAQGAAGGAAYDGGLVWLVPTIAAPAAEC